MATSMTSANQAFPIRDYRVGDRVLVKVWPITGWAEGPPDLIPAVVMEPPIHHGDPYKVKWLDQQQPHPRHYFYPQHMRPLRAEDMSGILAQ